MDTFFLILTATVLVLAGGFNLGTSVQRPETRKETIQWCIRNSQECKKEFDFYKDQVEVRKFQENSK